MPTPTRAPRPHTPRARRQLAAALSACCMLAACVPAVTLLTGCARTRVAEALLTDYPPDDIAAELAFWHNLPARTAVSNDAALHALLLLADGKDDAKNYADRVSAAIARKWLPEGFDEPSDLAAQRGRVAVAVARILDVRGGVMMQLLGPTPRYATRELIALGLLPSSSSELQAISGIELLAIVGRAQDVLTAREAGRRADAAPPQAPVDIKPLPRPEPVPQPSPDPAPAPSPAPPPASAEPAGARPTP